MRRPILLGVAILLTGLLAPGVDAATCPGVLRIYSTFHADVWGGPLGAEGHVDPLGCHPTPVDLGRSLAAGEDVRFVFERAHSGSKLIVDVGFHFVDDGQTAEPPWAKPQCDAPPGRTNRTMHPVTLREREPSVALPPWPQAPTRVYEAYATPPIVVPGGVVGVWGQLRDASLQPVQVSGKDVIACAARAP